MSIETLYLRDFRCFADFVMDFDENLTVLVAPNGQGKTAILEAISIVLGTFVGAFDLGKAKHIERTDARYGSRTGLQSEQRYPVSIAADLKLSDGRLISVRRELSGSKNKSTIKEAAALTQYGKELQSQIRQEVPTTLPVVAYYSTGRLWKAHNLSTRKWLTAGRSLGYEDCLSSASSFTQVQAWIAKATLAQLQTPQEPSPSIAIDSRSSEPSTWQQRVIHSLRQAFPKIQFIVTTHSPQVLSTVDRTAIRLLSQTSDDNLLTMHSETPNLQTQGVSSSDILAQVMGVDPVPDEAAARWLSEYKALIQQNQQEAELAQSLRQQLEQHFGSEHPAIVECDR